MINAITGVPGEGKTCFSVQHIILKELMVGDRPIFSNVAWHNDEVLKFCKSYGYEVDPNRLQTLSEEQIPTFWEHTPKNCLIVLDEVAEFFNAQQWKDIGAKAGAYARQHRKLGHETYLVVQDLGHIYKQFRDMVFEEIRIVNLSNRKLGIFRLPRFFLAKWIIKDSGQVQQTKLYRFNTEVFKTYSTLATVGGLLTTGDEVKVKKTKRVRTVKDFKQKIFNFLGLYWVPISITLFIVSLFMVPKLVFYDEFQEELTEENSQQVANTEIEQNNEQSSSNSFLNVSERTFLDSDKGEYAPNYTGRYDSVGTRPIRPKNTF